VGASSLPPSWPSWTRQLLVVAGLTGFAISQPLLSILGDEPALLAFYGISGSSLVLLVVLIAFVPPLALWAVGRICGFASPRVARLVHVATVAFLAACFAIQVAKALGLDQRFLLLMVAIGAGAAFALAYVRVPVVGLWASYTAALPVLATVMFLATSPASALLSSVEEPEPVETAQDVPSVVMIVLDELPTRSLLDASGGIDRDRFPSFAAFADEATWYRHHTSLASVTETAVPSLLTGQAPNTKPAVYAAHPDNLFSLLAPTHDLEVLESATKLCPYDSCAPTVDGEEPSTTTDVRLQPLLGEVRSLWFDRIALGPTEPLALDDFAEEIESTGPSSPTVTTAPSERQAQQGRFVQNDDQLMATSARAQTFIDSFDSTKDPALYFLHLLLPHQPWRRYPDGTLYQEYDAPGLTLPEADKPARSTWSPWVATTTEQRHLLQLQYTDAVLGSIVAGLRDAGIYDEAAVVVVSDHGASFEADTGTRRVTPETIDGIAYTPLFVKAPDQAAGVVDDANTMGYDVVPTIAELVGVDVTWPVDGAPAHGPEVATRGGAKQVYVFTGILGAKIDDILDFEDSDVFPSLWPGRSIGALPDVDDPLSALNAQLGLDDDVLGRPLDELRPVPGGGITIDGLDSIQRPDPSESQVGVVTGRVPDAPDDARLVLAVDGTIVGGSRLSTDSSGVDGRFVVLVPAGTFVEDHEVRAALLVGEEVLELEVSG